MLNFDKVIIKDKMIIAKGISSSHQNILTIKKYCCRLRWCKNAKKLFKFHTKIEIYIWLHKWNVTSFILILKTKQTSINGNMREFWIWMVSGFNLIYTWINISCFNVWKTWLYHSAAAISQYSRIIFMSFILTRNLCNSTQHLM